MTAAGAGTGARPDRRRVRLVFGGLVLTVLLASLDQTILSSALPTIVGELGGVGLMPWVITAYLPAATVVMPVHGRLGDLIGLAGWVAQTLLGVAALGALVEVPPWLGLLLVLVPLVLGAGVALVARRRAGSRSAGT